MAHCSLSRERSSNLGNLTVMTDATMLPIKKSMRKPWTMKETSSSSTTWSFFRSMKETGTTMNKKMITMMIMSSELMISRTALAEVWCQLRAKKWKFLIISTHLWMNTTRKSLSACKSSRNFSRRKNRPCSRTPCSPCTKGSLQRRKLSTQTCQSRCKTWAVCTASSFLTANSKWWCIRISKPSAAVKIKAVCAKWSYFNKKTAEKIDRKGLKRIKLECRSET